MTAIAAAESTPLVAFTLPPLSARWGYTVHDAGKSVYAILTRQA